MKKISLIMLFAIACNLAFVQTDENKKSVFQFSFFSPIGTNGLNSAKTTNVASLNLLVGVSKNEEAFTLGDASINYMETKNLSAGNLFPNHSLWKGDNAAKLQQVYIGYQVGVQYIF